ncbi:PH domain-containing protein [Shewanella abyssi]|uniref:PH domain-containing protein n=1 Tax=Shewanella abyssi TaxID=311789 RepID=UPI00200CA663|nr:PH domain-containing protein [Shewanella abyssi]MCL1051516.1 PH domain-containing protein [Shewanella abyssi]
MSPTGDDSSDTDIVDEDNECYKSNEMDNSHLKKTNTAANTSTMTKTEDVAAAAEIIPNRSLMVEQTSTEEHESSVPYSAHTPVTQAQWQGFNEVPLQKIDDRHYTQILYESLFFSFVAFTAVSLITILPGELSLVIVLAILTTLLLLLCSIGYLRHLQAAKLGYAACEHEFLMEKGLWWHKRTSLPYSRLQHVSLSQGPLERHFKLFTLKCFSAGSGSAEIELPGIEQHTAEHLRQHLLAQAAKAHLADPQASETETLAAESAVNHLTSEPTVKKAEANHDQ